MAFTGAGETGCGMLFTGAGETGRGLVSGVLAHPVTNPNPGIIFGSHGPGESGDEAR